MIYKIGMKIKGEKGKWKDVYVNAKSVEQAIKEAKDNETSDLEFVVMSVEETDVEIVN